LDEKELINLKGPWLIC